MQDNASLTFSEAIDTSGVYSDSFDRVLLLRCSSVDDSIKAMVRVGGREVLKLECGIGGFNKLFGRNLLSAAVVAEDGQTRDMDV